MPTEEKEKKKKKLKGSHLHRSIKIYLSKLKRMPSTLHLPHPTPNSLLSSCKYPKTPSFAAADRHLSSSNDTSTATAAAATLSDVDRFLFENFHSLYAAEGSDEASSPRYDDDDPGAAPPPVRPSDRFFVSPATSNSLLEESRASAASSSASSSSSLASSSVPLEDPPVPGGGVAVTTFSKDPYEDFRRSMQDMVDARHVDPRQPLDWDFMEELLFCYLELNDRSVHKYILRAFTDLTVSFRRRVPAGRKKVPEVVRSRRRRGDVSFPAGQRLN